MIAGSLLGVLLMLGAPLPSGATVPQGFADSQIATGLLRPTAMAFAPDGRLFVAEQGGALRVIKNGSLLSKPFVKLDVDGQGERGLLGVALDPNFATNNYVYLYYTAKSPSPHNRVSRFTANGNVAVAGSQRILLELNNLSSAFNHNGGAMHFGTDGKLYIAVGDNADGTNAQSMATLKGKMLRINKSGTIPVDNPFYATATGKNRAIWALGLRNPFSFAVRPTTGRIFINDVGETMWEEINDGAAGANYGWPTTEGYTTDPRYRSPVHAYGHDNGSCAITGGAFYDPATAQFPSSYVGDYFFADFCGGWIKRYQPSDGSVQPFASGINKPVDVQVSSGGGLFYLARGTGSVHRILYSTAGPAISEQPSGQTVRVGEGATFSVVASGTGPFTYQWQRNGSDISGATASSYTLANATEADDGASFRVVVSNSSGSVVSNAAVLRVTTSQGPTATITAPAPGSLYSGGSTINYSGSATDPEDGDLPASRFTWWVDFHHADHTHPFIDRRSGAKSGSFVIPRRGETSTHVWYRIHLEVRDSAGLIDHVWRDITPRTSTITLATKPSGLKVLLDGSPVVAPHSFRSVVGSIRKIGAVSPQTANARQYLFDSWSDGKAASHEITTPRLDKTYTATYR